MGEKNEISLRKKYKNLVFGENYKNIDERTCEYLFHPRKINRSLIRNLKQIFRHSAPFSKGFHNSENALKAYVINFPRCGTALSLYEVNIFLLKHKKIARKKISLFLIKLLFFVWFFYCLFFFDVTRKEEMEGVNKRFLEDDKRRCLFFTSHSQFPTPCPSETFLSW